MKYHKHTLTVVPAGSLDDGLPVALERAQDTAKEELAHQRPGATYKLVSHSVFQRAGSNSYWLSCVFRVKTV